jgi:hypothetical protein
MLHSGWKKNGIHWGNINAAPYHISDSTKSAEVYRLIATHAAGRK